MTMYLPEMKRGQDPMPPKQLICTKNWTSYVLSSAGKQEKTLKNISMHKIVASIQVSYKSNMFKLRYSMQRHNDQSKMETPKVNKNNIHTIICSCQ